MANKPLDLPLKNRLARKAIPNGCDKAWWYAEQNGDISIYGKSYKGEAFNVIIKARSLKVLRPTDTRTKP